MAIAPAEFKRVRELLYQLSGISLSDAKENLVEARLNKRVRALGLPGYGAYLDLIASDLGGEETTEFINALTTNKTAFFRENHHFDFLRREIFGRRRPSDPPIRIWSAASSSGQEPYSIAMVARETGTPVTILASDIDTQVLAKAGQAVYPLSDFSEVDARLWQRHCLKGSGASAGMVRIRPDVANLVDFRQINLIGTDWQGIGPFDVIFCRNVIIYFDRPTQQRLMERFAELLRPGGWLILGHSETLTWLGPLFEPLGDTVYRKPGGSALPPPAPVAVATAPTEPSKPVEPKLKENRIIAGGVYASDQPSIVRTLLGSCVAACLYDPAKGIGGMNHFMLPTSLEVDNMPARFGVHAMELLINRIMNLGGDRRRLKAKVFGASRVIEAFKEGPQVAEKNALFIREFLKAEGIPIVAEKLGGTEPLEVRFHIHSGRVQVKALATKAAKDALADERKYRARVVVEAAQPAAASVELF